MRERITWRSPLVVMLAFATMIGLGGLIYAHWFSEATIDGGVNTGGVSVMWVDGWTNDDGVDNGDGEGGGPAGGFDLWGPESSADPSADGRYDKDVGRCAIWNDFGGDFFGDYLGVMLDNVYPSYHCTATGVLRGADGVPAKSIGYVLYRDEFARQVGWDPEWDGPVCWSDSGTPEDDSDDFEYAETAEGFDGDCQFSTYDEGDFIVTPIFEQFDLELDGDVVMVKDGEDGTVLTLTAPAMCGMQVDPLYDLIGQEIEGDSLEWELGIHVGQAAEQNSGFQFRIHPRFVNWNEYDSLAYCGVQILDTMPEG